MKMQLLKPCTCPSGDGSLRHPCPIHPAAAHHVIPVWVVTRDGDSTFPRSYFSEAGADKAVASIVMPPYAVKHTPLAAATSFQAGVSDWMAKCFVPSLYSDMTERGDRLLEEVLELLQAHSYDRGRVSTLVDYVFGRPAGEPAQEVGGVMVTLAGYCWLAGLDMHAAGDTELARITQPEVMAKIRAKQEAKNAIHFDTPLPGSAPAAPGIDLADVSLAAQMLTWGREEGLTETQIAEIDAHQQKLFALIDASPKGGNDEANIPAPHRECYSDDGGDSWYEHPADAELVYGLKVGDTYTLIVSHCSVERTYRVTKAPDEASDDYEVEPVQATGAEVGA